MSFLSMHAWFLSSLAVGGIISIGQLGFLSIS